MLFARMLPFLLLLAFASARAEEVRLSDQERFYGISPGMRSGEAIELLKAVVRQKHEKFKGSVEFSDWLKADGTKNGVFTITQTSCEPPCSQVEVMDVTALPESEGGWVSGVIIRFKPGSVDAFRRTAMKYQALLGEPDDHAEEADRKMRAWKLDGGRTLKVSYLAADKNDPETVMLWLQSEDIQRKVREAMAKYRYR